MRNSFQPLLVLALTGLLSTASAVTPRPEEMLACKTWSDSVFSAQGEAGGGAFLKLLYEDAADEIARVRSWRGTPFQLGEKTYTNGLAFNATKHILVHLGKPARRFTADIGLENNDDTRRGEAQGAGSVTFHVLVGGKEVFASTVRRRKDGPLPLSVPLEGAREFEIRVGDGGDGRGWDQALWAEATVLLEDGSSVSLHALPWEGNPFGLSFQYGGASSAELLGQWPRKVEERAPGERSTRRDVLYLDPATGLELRVQTERFTDFPAVEWVVFLTNHGATNTPLLEDFQVLDSVLPVPTSGEATLHWAKGGVASFDDFAPQTTGLKAGEKRRFQPGGGRSSNEVLPFFNLQGADGGVIAAVGWSGEWAAEFAGGPRGQVSLKAGLARTHLRLLPGESIRTPRILLLFYQGDRWRGQNLLRQFILAHHRPLRGGKPLLAPITCGNWGGTRAEVHLDNIQKFIQHQLPIEYYWIDAEWYGKGDWASNVGNWRVKPDLYPAGFKPLSDTLRASGRELMLWFEPERVIKGTEWQREHRDWMFDHGGNTLLFNLGNPQARQFVTDFISDRITEFGLGCYRQDFNMDPLPYWHAADAPDRQGMAETRHIEGLYAFWDDLLKRHPNLIIDNCASGGRRIDLETIGRSTPFWRTDGPRDAIAHQCHTYGLMPWVPLSATSQDREGDDYEFRSSMCSALCINWAHSGDGPCQRLPENFPFAWAKAALDQYLQLRSYYYGDFYPLTGYSQAADVWMAYQLDGPAPGKGLVVALRRPDSPYYSARFGLHGLDPSASYRVTNLDTRQQADYSGSVLTRDGLEIVLPSKPGSALLAYEAVK
jgi:alpha-galactosidase